VPDRRWPLPPCEASCAALLRSPRACASVGRERAAPRGRRQPKWALRMRRSVVSPGRCGSSYRCFECPSLVIRLVTNASGKRFAARRRMISSRLATTSARSTSTLGCLVSRRRPSSATSRRLRPTNGRARCSTARSGRRISHPSARRPSRGATRWRMRRRCSRADRHRSDGRRASSILGMDPRPKTSNGLRLKVPCGRFRLVRRTHCGSRKDFSRTVGKCLSMVGQPITGMPLAITGRGPAATSTGSVAVGCSRRC